MGVERGTEGSGGAGGAEGLQARARGIFLQARPGVEAGSRFRRVGAPNTTPTSYLSTIPSSISVDVCSPQCRNFRNSVHG